MGYGSSFCFSNAERLISRENRDDREDRGCARRPYEPCLKSREGCVKSVKIPRRVRQERQKSREGCVKSVKNPEKGASRAPNPEKGASRAPKSREGYVKSVKIPRRVCREDIKSREGHVDRHRDPRRARQEGVIPCEGCREGKGPREGAWSILIWTKNPEKGCCGRIRPKRLEAVFIDCKAPPLEGRINTSFFA